MKILPRLISRTALAVTIVAALLLALAPMPAEAGKKSNNSSKGFYKGTVIKAVNVASSTIEIETMKDNSTHTYKIDAMTVVTVAGTPGKISNLKFGQQVLNLVERDNDTLDVIAVDQADKYVKVK